MKNYFLITILLVLGFSVHSQEKSKDFNKQLNAANDKFKSGYFNAALNIYNAIINEDSLNKEINFNIAVCYYELKDYTKSEEHFLKSSSAVSLELFRYKASIAHINMKFKKAINFYNAYKLIAGKKDLSNDEINRLIEQVKYAELAINNKRDVLIQNLGTDINTKYDEYFPMINADESILLFTTRRNDHTLDLNDLPHEAIYGSKKNSNSWSEPKSLKVNILGGNSGAGFSADGQTLFIAKDISNSNSKDLYESKMGIDDWEELTKLGSDINSEYNESNGTITLDDKVLYFSSDRPGGFGGKDIYKVLRLPNGQWSKAMNLGATVNSPYDEDAPFIHSDKKTLYFSSKGHQNMGGYDVFKTVLENDVWTNPENLKYPINTCDDDIYYVVAANGKVAYYSSNREGGYGGQDIYKIVLKDESSQLFVVKAIITTKDGKTPLSAKITLIENESKKVHGIYKSNDVTGKFILLVNPEKTYNIIIESKDYHPMSADLEVDVNNNKLLEFKLDKKN
jgi:tetratricopeptide (TPR) repeat protein